MNAICNAQPITIVPEIESGYLLGYSVFTTFLVESGKTKAYSLHKERLRDQVKILMNIDIEENEIQKNIEAFIQTQNSPNFMVRVTVTPKNFSLICPEKIDEYSIVVTGREANTNHVMPFQKLSTMKMHRPLANLKTGDMTGYLYARSLAHQKGFSDALFTHNNIITEGPTWNIMFLKGNTVTLPNPSSKDFLNGITQRLIINNIPDKYDIVYKDINPDELQKFDAACITSGGVGVCAIESINNISFDTDLIRIFSETYKSIEGENIM